MLLKRLQISLKFSMALTDRFPPKRPFLQVLDGVPPENQIQLMMPLFMPQPIGERIRISKAGRVYHRSQQSHRFWFFNHGFAVIAHQGGETF
jgi:hypothetical protein